MLLVGPLAKTIAFAILHKVKAHDKRWAKILVISGTIALFMVAFMSLYGLVYNGQSVTSFILWSCLVATNVIMALPLNFLVVGPISRFILGRNYKNHCLVKKLVENFEDDDELPTII